MNIRASALSVSDPLTSFSDVDNWDISDSSAQYWVEAGIIKGTYCCNNYAATPSFFWGESRPGVGFASHQGGAATLNTYYYDKIRDLGGGSWSVNVGTLAGTSTNTFTTSQLVETGSEIATQDASVCSSQKDMGWWDAMGTHHSGWKDDQGYPTFVNDDPPYVRWIARPSWLREYANFSPC